MLPYEFRASLLGRLFPPTQHKFVIVNITENGSDGTYSGITLASFEHPDLFYGGGGEYNNPVTGRFERSWAILNSVLELASSNPASRMRHKPKRDYKRNYVF
jgi:hypothetical protein